MAPRHGDETRAALIRSAERLMARHGIEGVDLNEIQRDAGQRNRSAIAYHFGDRDGLVRAIGECHRVSINAERNRMLDALDPDAASVRDLVEAMVLPLAQSLETERGRDYLVVLAEAAARMGTSELIRTQRAHIDSVTRLVALLRPRLQGSPAARGVMIGRLILMCPVLLADVAREIERDDISLRQSRTRVRSLISLLEGGMTSGQAV